MGNRRNSLGNMARGQVTTFIIIGLLLLLAVGIVTYTEYLEFGRPKIIYPEGAQALANYVKTCVHDAGVRGVQLLGQQGGYIQLPLSIENEPRSYLSLDEFNLRKVPYWHYLGRTRIPTVKAMENQLNTYIKDDIMFCLQNFEPFVDQYIVFPQAEMEVDTQLTEKDVFVSVYYPLRAVVKANQLEYDIDTFNAEIDVKLKHAYELAEKILDHDFDNHAVGNVTLSLLAMDPEIPMDGLLFECGSDRWMIPDIKARLQRSLQQNALSFRVKDTVHAPFEASDSTYRSLRRAKDRMYAEMISSPDTMDIENTRAYPKNTPTDVFEYNNMYLDVGAEDDTLQAVFQYNPEYGMNMEVNPSRGGVLRSTDATGPGLMRFLCLQQFHFTYDVEYPLLVTVRDPSAFDGRGYLFEFAMPIAVDDNKPVSQRRTYDIFEDLTVDEEFCYTGGELAYEFRALGVDEDGYKSMSGLDDANISYFCAQRRCELGRTGARGGMYRLTTRLPLGCDDPFIKASKDGYLPAVEQLDSSRDKELFLELTKLRKLNVEVVKHKYYSAGNEIYGGEPLESDENVTIWFRIQGQDKDQFVQVPGVVEVIDGKGNYEIDAVLMGKGIILGGYRHSNLSLNYNDIQGTSTMQLHVFEYMPRPFDDDTQEDMMFYLLGESYNPQYEPRFT